MEKSVDEAPKDHSVGLPPPPKASAPPQADVEGGATSITRRWEREDLLKKGCLILRASAFIFSLLSFIIMASNNHGDWMNFDLYDEYKYLLAIAILSTVYTAAQTLRQVHQFYTGSALFEQRIVGICDFVGDQIIAYMLISAASAATPNTNRMRERIDNLFTDSSAASISMAFLAFFTLALSAMISGFKLSNQSYI